MAEYGWPELQIKRGKLTFNPHSVNVSAGGSTPAASTILSTEWYLQWCRRRSSSTVRSPCRSTRWVARAHSRAE